MAASPAAALLGFFFAASSAFGAGISATGVVRYEGPEVRPRPLRMDADPKCAEIYRGKPVPARDRLVAADGGVANVFVYLEEAPAGTGPFAVPEKPVDLTQKGCFYEPTVLGILVKQDLAVHNEDDTLHNVRCLAKENRPFNLGQPANTPPRTKFFTSPEQAVKFKCDVHPWMAAFIGVVSHPFHAVSNEAGEITLENVPEGEYEIEAWHEAFGRQTQKVKVEARKTAQLAITFKAQ